MPPTVTAAAPRCSPPAPLRANITTDFLLDPSINFLNHGSFGARPRKVLEAQNRRRAEFEAHPIQWLDRHRKGMIDRAKTALGQFIGAEQDNFGFVTNATGGINAVLRSIHFRTSDELITTNHVYNAVRKTMQHLADRVEGGGAKYVEVEVPLPLQSPDDIVRIIERALTARTRIVVIDHITSPTAVIFPVEQIARLCAARGIDLLVDGAHAPGMVPLNIESLGRAGVSYYAGNLHKWTCAPAGAGFIWVRSDRQTGVHPTTISHFLDESFVNEFNWQGTRDITPWLCVEDALQVMGGFGWPQVMRHNHEFAVWLQQMLCERWQVEPNTPLDGCMLGSMATVNLPAQQKLQRRFGDFISMRNWLYDEHRIEVPVVDWPTGTGNWRVRPCCQIYNRPEQYEHLADAVLNAVG